MTLVRDIIKSGYRKSGVVAAGVVPNSKQMAIGLELLQNEYDQMAVNGLFGRIQEVYLATNDAYTAQESQRVYCSVANTTVTLPRVVVTSPSFPHGPQLINAGKQRQPLDLAVVIVTKPFDSPPSLTTNIYDGGFGQWFVISELTYDAQAPLSTRYDKGLKAIMAVLLADENGYEIRPVLARDAGMVKLSLASRYQTQRVDGRSEYF